LTWNSGDEEKAEYIDYSTGKITKLPVEPVLDEEAPAHKHTLGGASPKITRHFTDREGFIDTFEDALANFDPEAHRVITYYGMGGIGKSRLRKNLQSMIDERDAPVTWTTLNFETAQHRTAADALYWMRNELQGKEGIQLLSFDLAYAVYWQKTHPQSAMQEDEVPFLDEETLITEFVDLAKTCLSCRSPRNSRNSFRKQARLYESGGVGVNKARYSIYTTWNQRASLNGSPPSGRAA